VELPDYVTVEEVQRVCTELGLCDWTAITEADVVVDEAARIWEELAIADMPVSMEDFRAGLAVELEHGMKFPEANVTNNHPILTGKIVVAHLRETLDYYKRLDVAELEGDLLKAIVAGNGAKAARKYAMLTKARTELAEAEAAQLG